MKNNRGTFDWKVCKNDNGQSRSLKVVSNCSRRWKWPQDDRVVYWRLEIHLRLKRCFSCMMYCCPILRLWNRKWTPPSTHHSFTTVWMQPWTALYAVDLQLCYRTFPYCKERSSMRNSTLQLYCVICSSEVPSHCSVICDLCSIFVADLSTAKHKLQLRHTVRLLYDPRFMQYICS